MTYRELADKIDKMPADFQNRLITIVLLTSKPETQLGLHVTLQQNDCLIPKLSDDLPILVSKESF